MVLFDLFLASPTFSLSTLEFCDQGINGWIVVVDTYGVVSQFY